MQPNLEIERKYLIRMPSREQFSAIADLQVWDITQTYLTDGSEGEMRRVRRIDTDGKTLYYFTAKRRLGGISHAEYEREIDRAEYDAYLRETDAQSNPICKRRYRFPYCGHTMELDVYSFWNDRATLEIELASEDEAAQIPDWINVIRDVSRERQYKNRYLAKNIPMEAIDT